MTLGVCTITLALSTLTSLKEKRGVLKPLIANMRKEFNVSVAEIEDQDVWRSAVLGLAIIGAEGANVHGALEGVVQWIERTQPHIQVANWDVEVL